MGLIYSGGTIGILVTCCNRRGPVWELIADVVPGGTELEPQVNTLRTGAFKLFKCTFPGSKQFKSTFILCFFKNL